MILAIDVFYKQNSAKTVAIGFKDWETEEIIEIQSIESNFNSEYISGEFYKRELPCILEVLKLFDLNKIELIIIDGYVQLNDEGKLGLGGHLFNFLDEKIPIIGVAKKSFNQAGNIQMEITRGKSKNPLYITSMGINLEISAEKIKNMQGDFRIPNLLKLVDQKSKEF